MIKFPIERLLCQIRSFTDPAGRRHPLETVRGSHKGAQKGVHLFGAVIHKEGVVIAQEEVGEKTNEIKHVKPFHRQRQSVSFIRVYQEP